MSKDEIMRRYRHPRYRVDVDAFRQNTEGSERCLWAEDENPFCGDSLRMAVCVSEEGRIVNAGYDGYGCSLCIASAEWLLDTVVGGTIQEAQKTYEEILHGLGDVQVSRNRKKCVELSQHLIRELTDQWEKEKGL
ncbi:MAG: iron-sulfur cluster assembly scaffold protein [Lachnospiraceae bacterium]|nr:iron-sulfur cluster assembly scaffold protein [Lachnospiraceae bacterium]